MLEAMYTSGPIPTKRSSARRPRRPQSKGETLKKSPAYLPPDPRHWDSRSRCNMPNSTNHGSLPQFSATDSPFSCRVVSFAVATRSPFLEQREGQL